MNEPIVSIKIRATFGNNDNDVFDENRKILGYQFEISKDEILASKCDDYTCYINKMVEEFRTNLVAGFNQYVKDIKEEYNEKNG